MNNIFQYADLNETPFFPKIHALPVLSEDIESILDNVKTSHVFLNIGGKIANYLKLFKLQDDEHARTDKVGFNLLFIENYEDYGVSPFVITKGNINHIKDSLPVEMKVYFRSMGKVKSKERVMEKASLCVKNYLRLISVLSLDDLHIVGNLHKTSITFDMKEPDNNLVSYVIDKFYRERHMFGFNCELVYFIRKGDSLTITTAQPTGVSGGTVTTLVLKDPYTSDKAVIPTVLATIADLLEIKNIEIDHSAYKLNGHKKSNLEQDATMPKPSFETLTDPVEQLNHATTDHDLVSYLSLVLNAVDNVKLPANGKVLLCTTNDIELTAHQLNRPAVKALLVRNKHIGIQFTPNSNPFDTNEYIVNLVRL